MESMSLSVEGMTCGGCIASVKRVLEAVPGVQSATVTLDPGRAIIVYDASRVTAEALRGAVEDAGYAVAG